ncbi:hypothetical protein RI129_011436 [Pyrocoelia pectoralis]|uniref:Cytochrome P450 n=1 Tax=Pyrocoelia pectoralis TaxID=417401 RepID=A0AAN7ZBE9_9COLE
MSLTIIFAILLITIGLIHSMRKPRNFPPGPLWIPIIGSSFHFGKAGKAVRGGPHVVLEILSRRWKTNVIGLKFGGQIVVSVSTYSTIKTVLENEAFNARPNNFFAKQRTIGKAPGITFAEGRIWNDQRKFLTRHLRNVGLGKSVLEVNIREELEDVISLIDGKSEAVSIGELVQPAVVSSIWSLIAGERLSRTDSKFQSLLLMLNKRSEAFDMGGGTLSNYPWLRFIAPGRVGFTLIKRLNVQLREILMETIDQHQGTWTLGNDSDLMYSFISHMHEQDEGEKSLDNEQLLMVCLDLFVAGAHSTGGTLDCACLMMLLHPDIQSKAQEVLDKEFSSSHSFTYSDRHKVPYIQAILSEVERLHQVFPIAGSRRALKDVDIEGYTIPKDSTILINLYSVFMSKEVWGDPENFRPERFLNDHGKLIIYDEFVPFSTGRRRCLGEPLARSFLFIFFAQLLRRYRILPMEGKALPSSILRTGIVSLPQPYSARFVQRTN